MPRIEGPKPKIEDYKDGKVRGLVTLAKVGAAFVIAKKQFDPSTGDELDPVVIGVDKKQFEDKKESLLKQIENIDAMIADMEALE